MNGHPVLWTSPAPLWGRFEGDGGGPDFRAADQARPAILRFTSDDFMERLLAMMETDPRQLGETIARPETWRAPAGATPDLRQRAPLPRLARSLARLRRGEASSIALKPTTAEADLDAPAGTERMELKLYHPAHQRYYLVGANLVCAIPGFPDRAVATGGREQIGFVLRRMLRPNGSSEAEEFAFVKGGIGARWQRLPVGPNSTDTAAVLADGEEMLPLFPVTFRDDVAHPRRLFAGMVPVGRREEYMSSRKETARATSGGGGITGGGTSASLPPLQTAKTARKEQFRMEVSEPWKNLIRTAHRAAAVIMEEVDGDAMPLDDKNKAALAANQQLQGQSWLLLLDFADYLARHLPRVWSWVSDAPQKPTLESSERTLFNWMNNAGMPGGNTVWRLPANEFVGSLKEALRSVGGARAGLEGAVRSYPDAPGDVLSWPGFLFLLAGVRGSGTTFAADGIHSTIPSPTPAEDRNDSDALSPRTGTQTAVMKAEAAAAPLDKLVQLVINALPAEEDKNRPAPPMPFAAELRNALATTADDGGWFVLRCAYVRCDCGPLHPPVMSAPSQQFQLASFFDPDAPARPIRIALPLDTTPAGLRKFNNNTAFVLSDVLCGQVQRAKGLGFIDLVLAVLPWPFHKDLDVPGMGPCERGAAFGMICSLSIPIITICALILLIIIVTLLDLIFKWLPWFIVCFPIFGLKGKKAT
jgi:hypothetical protein